MTGALTVGDLVMVNGLLFQLAIPLGFLGTFWRDMSTSAIELQDLYKLLNRQPLVKVGRALRFNPVDVRRGLCSQIIINVSHSTHKSLFNCTSIKVVAGTCIRIPNYIFLYRHLHVAQATPGAPRLHLPTALAPTIVFDNVAFKYDIDKPYILNDMSFEVPSGKKIAIVGGSGSGLVRIVEWLFPHAIQ